jgi:hypothetical protein
MAAAQHDNLLRGRSQRSSWHYKDVEKRIVPLAEAGMICFFKII